MNIIFQVLQILFTFQVISCQTGLPPGWSIQNPYFSPFNPGSTETLRQMYVDETRGLMYLNGPAQINQATSNCFIYKHNMANFNALLWSRSYGTALADDCGPMAGDPSIGDIFVSGTTNSSAAMFLIKINSAGQIVWESTYTTTQNDRPAQIHLNVGLDRVCVTIISDNIGTSLKCYLISTGAPMLIMWKSFNSLYTEGIVSAQKQDEILVGLLNSTVPNKPFSLTGISPTTGIRNVFTTDALPGASSLSEMVYLSDENTVIVSGKYNRGFSPGGGVTDLLFVAKVSMTGSRLWLTTYETKDVQSTISMSYRPTTNEIFVGTSFNDIGLLIINAKTGGLYQSVITISSTQTDQCFSVYAMKSNRDMFLVTAFGTNLNSLTTHRVMKLSGPLLFLPPVTTTSSLRSSVTSSVISSSSSSSRRFSTSSSLSVTAISSKASLSTASSPRPNILPSKTTGTTSTTLVASMTGVNSSSDSSPDSTSVDSPADSSSTDTNSGSSSSTSHASKAETENFDILAPSFRMYLYAIIGGTGLIVIMISIFISYRCRVRPRHIRNPNRNPKLNMSTKKLQTSQNDLHNGYQENDIDTMVNLATVNTTASMTWAANSTDFLSVPGFLMIDSDMIRLETMIGEGGGGKVYKCSIFDETLQGQVFAAKVLEKKTTTPSGIWAFKQELSIMNMFKSSAFITKLVAYSESPYIMVMKYYSQGTLQHWTKSKKSTKAKMSLFSLDIARGLYDLHSKGVVHLDIKPSNVLIEYSQEYGRYVCVISDFGLARIISNEVLLVQEFNAVQIKGMSRMYAAPEVIQRHKKYREDAPSTNELKAADIYSFGMIFNFILGKGKLKMYTKTSKGVHASGSVPLKGSRGLAQSQGLAGSQGFGV